MLRCFWIILYGVLTITSALGNQVDKRPISSGVKATIVTNTGNSEQLVTSDRLLTNLNNCVSNFDRDGIRQCVEQLAADGETTKNLTKALLIEANFATEYVGDDSLALRNLKKITSLTPDSQDGLVARIKLADIADHGSFKESLKEYETILQEFPSLSASQRNHINCQLGIFSWQLNDQSRAESEFKKIMQGEKISSDSDNSWETAKLHLKAFQSSESIPMMVVLYDRAMRWRDSKICRDLCWKDLTRFLELSRQPFFEKFCNDPAISSQLRADLLYKVTLADFEMGNHDQIPDITGRALKLNPGDALKQRILYIQAYHHAHCRHFEHAIMIYRQILEGPADTEITPNTYWELAKTLVKANDREGMLKLAEEFCMLYPYRVEATRFRRAQEQELLFHPELKNQFAKIQEEVSAIRSSKIPTNLPMAEDRNEMYYNKSTVAMEVLK